MSTKNAWAPEQGRRADRFAAQEPGVGSAESDRTDHLMALQDLVEEVFPNATQFFSHGLALLVERLGIERAAMTRVTDMGLETCWWATAEGIGPEDPIHESDELFCSRVVDRPQRILLIPDVLTDPGFNGHPGLKRLGIHTYLGASLQHSGKTIGVLSLQSAKPRAYTPLEIALVKAVAALFSKTLEVETLREELDATRNVLDLTAAVVEDNALENSNTHLPNRRYLDIWLKAHLYLARRRGEPMTVAIWLTPSAKEAQEQLREIASALRGEDLLTDLGKECLLLLPHTGIEGAQILLERIRAVVGPIAMGATLWQPEHPVDRDDLSIQQAFLRATEARRYSEESGPNGQCEVQWMLLMEPGEGNEITTPE